MVNLLCLFYFMFLYLCRRANNIRRNRAAITIQRFVRGWIKKIQYDRVRYSIKGIQRYARGYLARLHYMQLLYNAKVRRT